MLSWTKGGTVNPFRVLTFILVEELKPAVTANENSTLKHAERVLTDFDPGVVNWIERIIVQK
jgi:hypothetical protein